MPVVRILFISGSIGLGHVTRDLAIARALRRRVQGLQVTWLAADAARMALEISGEQLHPAAAGYTGATGFLESLACGLGLRLMDPTSLFRSGGCIRSFRGFIDGIRNNVQALSEATRNQKWDLVIGDETWELVIALARNPALKTFPFVLITDFAGVDPVSRRLVERLTCHFVNRAWSRLYANRSGTCDRHLFVGVEEDIPDKPFGWRLPNRRELARRALTYLGYILSFEPLDGEDPQQFRKHHQIGDGPLVVVSVGGTSIGSPLLRMCLEAFPRLRDRVPDLRMILVCGPNIPPEDFIATAGMDVLGFVPDLPRFFAACDVAVVQGGGTSTLELTALGKPFLFFPLEGHFEQQGPVAERLARQGAGIRMEFAATTPESLTGSILEALNAPRRFQEIPFDGAEKAAEIIASMIRKPA